MISLALTLTVAGAANAAGPASGSLPYAEVTFEIGFEILPGTASKAVAVDLNPYEIPVDSSQVRGE